MKFIKVYIFLAGFAITGVEMAASRFLAPYFGTSSVVWANVIGVILLAMALGYATGGRLVDRYPAEEMLYRFGAIGAVILGILPLVGNLVLLPLSGGLLHTDLGIILATFLATLLLFGLPIFFLAMLSPYAVRLLSDDLSVVGSRAGALSFWSTLGSILGIYVTSLYLIPFVGVRETIWLFAVCLFIPSVFRLSRRLPLVALAVVVLLLNVLVPPRPALAFGTLLQMQESTYQHIKVVEQNGTRYLYFNEGEGVQSIYNPALGWTGEYYDYAAPLLLLERFAGKKDLHVLVLGYAGGTIGKLLHRGAPAGMQVHIDGVEIDPVVTRLSKEYFGVTEDERTMHTMDGRSFVHQATKKYDLIVIDAYSQEIYIPPHMITKEFFSEVASALTPEGIIIFNLNVLDTSSPLFTGALNTLAAAGLQSQSLAVGNSYNHWIVASKDSIHFVFNGVTEDPRMLALLKAWEDVRPLPMPPGLVFTDNNSPVEMLVHGEILRGFLGN